MSLRTLFGSRKPAPVDEIVDKLVLVETITLSEEGLSMLLIDEEYRNNSNRYLKLKKRKEELLRDLRDIDYEIDTITSRQTALKTFISKLRSIPITGMDFYAARNVIPPPKKL